MAWWKKAASWVLNPVGTALGYGIDAIGHNIAGDKWDNSTAAKLATGVITGDVPKIVDSGLDLAQKISDDIDEKNAEAKAEEAEAKRLAEEEAKRKQQEEKNAADAKAKADREASTAGLAEAEALAKAGYTQARTQGLDRGLAASIGNAPFASYTAANYQNNSGLLSSAKTSTQADYLNKMGYANAMNQQAENVKNGAGYTIASGVMQGAGLGLGVGNSLSR